MNPFYAYTLTAAFSTAFSNAFDSQYEPIVLELVAAQFYEAGAEALEITE